MHGHPERGEEGIENVNETEFAGHFGRKQGLRDLSSLKTQGDIRDVSDSGRQYGERMTRSDQQNADDPSAKVAPGGGVSVKPHGAPANPEMAILAAAELDAITQIVADPTDRCDTRAELNFVPSPDQVIGDDNVIADPASQNVCEILFLK